jgi:WD40 repeat protein
MELVGHSARISAVATSDQANLAVSADENGTIALWKTQGPKASKVATFKWHLKNEAGVDARTAKPAAAEVLAKITSLALNAEGTLLAASSREKVIGLWNVSDPGEPKQVALFGSGYHSSEIQEVAFVKAGPDAGKLVSADADGRLGIWAGTPGEKAKPQIELKTAEPLAILSMAISPDGRWIFAGDRLGDLHLWGLRPASGSQPDTRITRKQSRSRINAMAFAADGNTLFSVGEDNVLIKWSLPANLESAAAIQQEISVTRLPGWDEKLYSVASHPTRDGVVVIGGSKGVMLVDTTRPSQLVKPILGNGIPAQKWLGLAASANLGAILALGPDAKTVHVLKKSGDQYQTAVIPQMLEAKVDGLATTRSGSHFAAQTCSGEVQVLRDTGSPQDVWKIVQPAGVAPRICLYKNAIAFSPDGTLLVAASGPVVRMWSRTKKGIEAGADAWKLETEKRFDKDVVTLAFNADGTRLAFGGTSNWLEIWQVARNQIADQVVAKKGTLTTQVLALAFSADGQTLVSATENLELSAWSVKDLKTRSSLGDLHERAVDNIVVGEREGVQTMFSVDREGQLVACFDQFVNANCTRLGRSFGNPIRGMAISADGTSLVVAGPGLFIWNLNRKDMLDTVTRLASEGR